MAIHQVFYAVLKFGFDVFDVKQVLPTGWDLLVGFFIIIWTRIEIIFRFRSLGSMQVDENSCIGHTQG